MQDIRSKLAWRAIKTLIRLRFPQVHSLTVAQLAAWLHQPEHPLLLDARQPTEYQVSHLPGACLAPADLSQLQQFKQQPLVVYCSVGYRSARLADCLQQSGFDVYNLEGSIFEWANAGYPVYRSNETVRQVHPYNSQWGKLLRSDWHC